MIYHIIIQDKFFETYIEDIYRLHEETNNVIWVRGDKGQSPYFHTTHEVEYLGNNSEHIVEKLKVLKPEDKLIIAWYDLYIGRVVMASQISCPIYVYLLGADFYGEPEWWHVNWLYDKKTKKRFLKEYYYPIFLRKHRLSRIGKYIDDFKRYRVLKKTTRQDYEDKNKSLSYVDYIVLTEHSGPEIEFVKQLYPACHAQHIPGVFDQNFDIAKQLDMKSVPDGKQPIKILFGNSSDPTGNHIDAFDYIAKNIKCDYEIYSFLSYGDKKCKDWAIAYGKEVLGDKFHPVVDFMDKVSFVKFMNEMDVIMMFHNRQQAEGNIMTSLVLGKPVFMKPANPQYGMLKRMGVVPVYDVRTMHEMDLIEAIRCAQQHRQETIKHVGAEYSMETRLKHLEKIIK